MPAWPYALGQNIMAIETCGMRAERKQETGREEPTRPHLLMFPKPTIAPLTGDQVFKTCAFRGIHFRIMTFHR